MAETSTATNTTANVTPFLADVDLKVYLGDVFQVLPELPDGSVDCVITSPPYFGLRDYGTATWVGGDDSCDHLQPVGGAGKSTLNTGTASSQRTSQETQRTPFKATCGKCGATRVDAQLGLEASPEEYVEKMVLVFREVRRVLADHGTLWLNIGDSYAGSGKGGNPEGSEWAGFVGGKEREQAAQASKPMIPDGLKAKDLMGMPWRVAFALQADGWYLRSDIVWCLSGGTRLYAQTQKGEQPQMLKDLVRLDPSTVKLWNGDGWTRVVSWNRSEIRGEPLEVELKSGEKLNCTPGHVWPTSRGNVRADELVAGDVITTTALPEPEIPDRPEFLPDEEIGYLAGRYLADGSMSGDTVQIACHTDEADGLELQLSSIARSLHGSAVAHRTASKSATVNMNGPLSAAVIRAYVYGHDAKTKGLTARVWRRSNVFLRALLQGYLDGDAHYDEANRRYRLGFTRNDRLAADLRTLAARLDLPIRLSIGFANGFGRRWPTYRGDIRTERSSHWNSREGGMVLAVRRSRGRHFWDVEVEDAPNVFSLGSGVLTHNSKPNPMPESITDRPTRSHEYVFMLSKQPRYFFDQEAVREPFTSGSEERYRYAFGGAKNEDLIRQDLEGQGGNRTAVVGRRTFPGGVESGQETLDPSLPPEAPRGPDGRKKTTREAGEGSHPNHRNGPKERWPGWAERKEAGASRGNLGSSETGQNAVHGDGLSHDLGSPTVGRNVRSVWEIATHSFAEAHFATYPQELVRRCLLAGCPIRVCRVCGVPQTRVVKSGSGEAFNGDARDTGRPDGAERRNPRGGQKEFDSWSPPEQTGWSDCGHDDYRPGVVLDPFGGSGTTGLVARAHQRHSVLVELNPEYAAMIANRLQQLSLLA